MIKKVAVINDLSGFGKCSLTASIAILSAMGVQPCPMPTAVLTNQSGFKNHSCVDLTDSLHTYIDMWQKNGEGFDGIYSGYVANGNQIEIIAEFGYSLFPLCLIMILVPNQYVFQYGRTFLDAMLSIFPDSLINNFYLIQEMPADWITNLYDSNSGFGFNIFAEFYL